MPFDHAAKSIVVSSYDGNLQSWMTHSYTQQHEWAVPMQNEQKSHTKYVCMIALI